MTFRRSLITSITQDPEQSFFRAWPLRSSEHEDDQPNLTLVSSPVSPKTIFTQRKIPRPSNRKAYSEAFFRPQTWPEDEIILPISSPRHVPNIVHESSSFSRITEPSEIALADLNATRSSSVSERARRLLRAVNNRKSSNATTIDAERARHTNDDVKWKHEISGRWFEIRIGRKTQRNGGPRKDLEDRAPEGSEESMATRTKNTSDTNDTIGPDSDKTPNQSILLDSGQRKGFYHRTKRLLGVKHGSTTSINNPSRTLTSTLNVLERVSSTLKALTELIRTPPTSSASGSSQSIAGLHNRGPRLLPFYCHGGHSSSSSIRDLRTGVPPLNTPEPQAMYTGSDAQQYVRVELTSPDGPKYLPSEARRISTPPLPRSVGKPSSFFPDYNVTSNPDTTPNPDATEEPLVFRRQKKARRSGNYWHKAKLAADDAKEARSNFELNVPEHLPNSPLCPRHPKHHLTKGKGICVYHGRNKRIASEAGNNT